MTNQKTGEGKFTKGPQYVPTSWDAVCSVAVGPYWDVPGLGRFCSLDEARAAIAKATK